MAAIGSIDRFVSPQKLVSYFGLNPRVRQSGLGAAHHGRIGKAGRSHARAMLVDAASGRRPRRRGRWGVFIRVRAKRGRRIAAVAAARKLAVLCWRMLTKGEDYRWARPSLVAPMRRGAPILRRRPPGYGATQRRKRISAASGTRTSRPTGGARSGGDSVAKASRSLAARWRA